MGKIIYLILAIIGVILPMSQFIPATIAGEFSLNGLFKDMTQTRILTGVSLDFFIAATAAIVFIIIEGKKRKLSLVWVAIVGTFLIGLSFGLPFFLYLRERSLEKR